MINFQQVIDLQSTAFKSFLTALHMFNKMAS